MSDAIGESIARPMPPRDAAAGTTSQPQAAVSGPAPLLGAQGVAKTYGSVTALESVDVSVGDGEILTILGPSGSGKTTLLKIVAGFELPDAGSVVLGGQDITYASPAARGIGMVFQNYALFPHMKVADNIAFPLEMRRVGRDEIRRRVGEALELVGLAGYDARLPRQLSGGQQQRVALARAIVFRPRLLLLDEPFGALDRKLREQMQLEVKRLQRQLGIAALFVTHDQEEALVLSDRIAVMSRGRIEQIALPAEIYARPANRFVADFIGESNIFRARVTAVHGDRLEAECEGQVKAVVRGATPRRGGSDIALVIRPEAPRRLDDGETAENIMTGTVAEVIYLGDAVKYVLRLEQGGELVVRWPYLQSRRTLGVGEPVRVGWAGDLVHVVDWN
ncbi:MAG: ABC transporter ATP-binding protein [Hyphomicrobiaceae bacterium]